MLLKRKSPLTGKLNSMQLPISEEEYRNGVAKYNGGILLQDAFPTLDSDQRGFVKTGYTKDDWSQMFPQGDTSESFETQK